MSRITLLLILIAMCLPAREGFTSEVFYEDSGESFSDIYHHASDVVVAMPLGKSQIYRKELIPVHGGEDVIYTEQVELFEVKEILKSESIKAGHIIKVWTEPAYNYESTKAYYQYGDSESPVVEQYRPLHPVAENEQRILYLNTKEPQKAVYRYRAAEGMASLQAVKDIR